MSLLKKAGDVTQALPCLRLALGSRISFARRESAGYREMSAASQAPAAPNGWKKEGFLTKQVRKGPAARPPRCCCRRARRTLCVRGGVMPYRAGPHCEELEAPLLRAKGREPRVLRGRRGPRAQGRDPARGRRRRARRRPPPRALLLDHAGRARREAVRDRVRVGGGPGCMGERQGARAAPRRRRRLLMHVIDIETGWGCPRR